MKEISVRPSLGVQPCFADVSPSGRWLAAVNHGSRNYVTKVLRNGDGRFQTQVFHDDATVVLYPVGEDGRPGEPADLYYLEGEGPLPVQFGSHPHSVRFSPGGEFLLVCDKGGDQLWTFRIEERERKLIPCREKPFHTGAGSAPRHCVFHPEQPFVYVNYESRPVLDGFRYLSDGNLYPICSIQLKSEKKLDGIINGQSGLCISGTGDVLYTLMREVNQIFVFRICRDTGKAEQIQAFQMKEKGPRACSLSPDGRFLLVAAMDSQQVSSYPVEKDGTLGEATASFSQPTPGAILFLKRQIRDGGR